MTSIKNNKSNNNSKWYWVLLIQFTLMILIGISTSCGNRIPDPKPEPGSRNYVWEIDTLYMPMNYIASVWGSSSNNLWAVGAGGTANDRLLHYNGTSWSTYSSEIINCTAYALFGFSEDNVWMGGGAEWPDNGGAIWHYNGQKWTKHYIYDPDMSYNGIHIRNIWGNDPNNVYACGEIYTSHETTTIFRGFVLHYDGTSWSEIVRANFNSQFLSINEDDDNVYLFSFGINFDGADTVSFYIINNDSLKQIYSNTENIINWVGMTNINGKEYFAIDDDVYLYENEELNNVLSIEYDNFWWKVFGRNEKDMFFLMRDGYVHYNGSDMEYIYQFHSTDMRFIGEPLIIGDHIYYCLGYLGPNELILHGKLEDKDQK